ncbi:3612_t:CDS:1 [Funneliformis caledonium]|uniref:3612_t:CDS:1 n=1 Tax=Funneliformis caledonium TaxID=1117310 RepID=A0A9N9EG76_9GLOM|nr:3612_t:CDS:1 [Funneliformis caledonium]
MLKIVSGYLHRLAAYWFEENVDTIIRWNANSYAASSFVLLFLEKFSTEEKQNLWHHQLNTLYQGPYEKVDFYTGKFKRLLKKVDSSKTLSDKYIVRLFLNELRKNIITLVVFSYPKNIDEAIDAAKQVESSQYYEQQSLILTQLSGNNNAIDNLTNK